MTAGTDFRVEQIDHVELFVPDRYAAAEWYGDALGLEIVAECEHWATDPSGPLMISSDGGSTKIALFEGVPQAGEGVVGLRRLAFRTDGKGFLSLIGDDADRPALSADGVPLGASDAVDHDMAYSVYFKDPWGTPLEITTYDHDEVASALAMERL